MPSSRSAPGRSTAALEGSDVTPRHGAVRTASVRGDRVLQATIILHPRNPKANDLVSQTVRGQWHPLAFTPDDDAAFEKLYNPGDEAFGQAERFARHHGLRVLERSRARHDVVVEGPASAMESAFGVTLSHFVYEGGRYYGHEGPIHLPEELCEVVGGVLGLDNAPMHGPHVSVATGTRAFTPTELAGHYRFPEQRAEGHTIGLLEFGGGYDLRDIELFAERVGVTLPTITDIGVVGSSGQHGRNAPPSREEMRSVAAVWQKATSFAQVATRESFINSLEVTMDVELTAALGGGADIAVYFAPQGADGWRRALYTVMGEHYPGQPERHQARPTVLSVSWGESESMIGPMKLRLIHHTLTAVQRKGITVVCSSGDRGSSNSFEKATSANVNFPASSPAVVACGGTTITHLGDHAVEAAWNGRFFDVPVASGGGMSGYFPRPPYQKSLDTPKSAGTWLAPGHDARFDGRWVPDVAANASFERGVHIVAGGRDLVGGGTSAAAPLWASLMIRLRAALSHPLVGMNAWLYPHAANGGCLDVSNGNNDVSDGAIPFYRARHGWDPCSGLGVPDGTALLAGLRATAPVPAARSASTKRAKSRA